MNIAQTYGSRDLNIVMGKGVYLFDDYGKKYIDCTSNFGVNVLGHSVDEISRRICGQSKLLINLHGSFENDLRSDYAQRMCQKTGMDKAFFCNSGTEAVEAAIKFARLATGKTGLIAAKMGYHGKTMGSLSLTRTLPKYNEPFLPLLESKHVPFDDAEALREMIDDATAAVFLEPIQGESGVRIPHSDYFRKVREICSEKGVMLVIDEIQTGMGRTGKFLAIEHFGIRPDMVCMAKGVAAGIPMGLVLMTEQINAKLYNGCHTNTFGGSPLACAVGLESLDYLEKNRLLDNAASVGEYFLSGLRKIESPVIREVRGLGLMIAIELKTKASPYIKKLQDNGILVIPTGPNIMRLLPPLILTRENADECVEKIKDVL